jgi:hypothetical protein
MRLQPGQLPTAAGLAETGTALVPDDAAGKARQDRRQGDATRQVRDVPTGRGGRHAELVRGHSPPHRAAGAAAAGCWPNAWVERHGGAEKASDSGGGPRTAGAEALKSTGWAMAPAVGTQKPQPWAKNGEKVTGAIDTAGRRIVTIRAISSLDRLQVQPIWEMSAKEGSGKCTSGISAPRAVVMERASLHFSCSHRVNS